MRGMSNMPQPAAVPPWTLGWRMRRALAFADIDVQDMAEQLGYDRRTLTRWLRDLQQPREVIVRQWAATTGVAYQWLKYGGEPPAPDDGGQRPSPDVGLIQSPGGRLRRGLNSGWRTAPCLRPLAA